MTIWKYQLVTTDIQTVTMPEGADVLCVQTQDDVPCLWVLVDPKRPSVTRRFRTHGTGHPVDASVGRYVGTYQLLGGNLVFHVFEEL
jgi:hypothetical protein